MPTRVLVIGLDAAQATLLEEWGEAGRIPAFERLNRASVFELQNSLETLPGSIWPEISSGRSGGHLGLFYHPAQIHTGESFPRPVEANEVDPEEYFWSVASRAGRRVAVVDVPQTVPTPDLNGVQLFEWGLHDRNFTIASEPPRLLEELRGRYGDHPVDSCDAFHGESLQGYQKLLDALLTGVRQKTRILLDVMDRENWDLFVGAFGESHCVGHQFWHFFDKHHPEHRQEAPEVLKNALPAVYEALARGVERAIEAAGDDAQILVLTSHGMGVKNGGPQLLPELLARLGIGPPMRGPIPEGESLRAKALRGHARALTWLWSAPQPMREGMKSLLPEAAWESLKRVLGVRKRDLQIPGIQAVPVRNNRCGAIRLNLAGREPQGMVQPGAQEQAVLQELSNHLAALTHPQSGKAIVERVVLSRDVFGAQHHPDIPDLLVVFRSDLGPLEACVSPTAGLIQASTRSASLPRTGDHTVDSRLWAKGSAFAPGRYHGNVLDVAPTVLELLNVGVPDDLDGQSLLAHARKQEVS